MACIVPALVTAAAVLPRGRGEVQLTIHEVVVADVQAGSEQAGDVDGRVAAEHDAVAIDEENLTIGDEVAENLAGILVEDAVQRGSRGGRLQELDSLVGSDIKGGRTLCDCTALLP